MAKLTFILEDGQEVVVPLTERITVGRAEDNDVVIDDERISSHHAELLINADGSVQVFDLQSTAGTTVNDVSIVSHTLLHSDRLAFGPLRAVLDLEDAAHAPDEETVVDVPDASPAKSEPKARSPAPPTPQAVPDKALHAAENLRALHEAAAKQAEAAHRDWLASIQALTLQHTVKTAELDSLKAATAAEQSKLDALTTAAKAAQQEMDARQQDATTRLQQLQESTTQEDTRLAETRRQLAEIQASIQEGQTLLNKQQEQSRAAQEQLASLQTQTTELAGTQEKLTQAQSQHAALTAAIASLQQQQEHERQQHALTLQQIHEQLTTAQSDLNACRSDLAAELPLLDAARTQRAALDAANAAPLETLNQDIETARRQLSQLTARLMPLRDWKEAQVQRTALLSTLPPGTPEARDLLHEIEAEADDLLRIITTPPSRTPHIFHIEHPHFTGVPMKSETTRIKDDGGS